MIVTLRPTLLQPPHPTQLITVLQPKFLQVTHIAALMDTMSTQNQAQHMIHQLQSTQTPLLPITMTATLKHTGLQLLTATTQLQRLVMNQLFLQDTVMIQQLHTTHTLNQSPLMIQLMDLTQQLQLLTTMTVVMIQPHQALLLQLLMTIAMQ